MYGFVYKYELHVVQGNFLFQRNKTHGTNKTICIYLFVVVWVHSYSLVSSKFSPYSLLVS